MPSNDLWAQYEVAGIVILSIVTVIGAIVAGVTKLITQWTSWQDKRDVAQQAWQEKMADMRERKLTERDAMYQKFFDIIQTRQEDSLKMLIADGQIMEATLKEIAILNAKHNELSYHFMAEMRERLSTGFQTEFGTELPGKKNPTRPRQE